MTELLTISESEADRYSQPEYKYSVESKEDGEEVQAASDVYSRISFSVDDDWDVQVSEDAEAGRLDYLAAEAIAEFRSGGTTDFPPDDE